MKIDGMRVIEGKRPMMLRITRNDVKRGAVKNPQNCAAALCLMRKPEVKAVRVHIARTYVLIGNKWQRFATSKPLRTEIIAFDRGGKFEPGPYHINPLPDCQKLGARYGGNKAKGAPRYKGTGRRRRPHLLTSVRRHGSLGVTRA